MLKLVKLERNKELEEAEESDVDALVLGVHHNVSTPQRAGQHGVKLDSISENSYASLGQRKASGVTGAKKGKRRQNERSLSRNIAAKAAVRTEDNVRLPPAHVAYQNGVDMFESQ